MLAVPLDIEADPQIAVARGAVMPRMQLDCGALVSNISSCSTDATLPPEA